MGNLEEQIKAKAVEMGYEACGIIESWDFAEHKAGVDKRTEIFPHASLFYDRVKRMTEPSEGTIESGSIIVALMRYDKYHLPERLKQYIGKAYLAGVYNYARADVASFQKYLHDLGLDPKPGGAPARWAAVKAGLGKFRNNNFVYTEKGSWNAIHTWNVNRKLKEDIPSQNPRFTCPEGCNQCVKACPTGALAGPMAMDPTRCAAFLTFFHETPLGEEFRFRMGQWIYGCDACQNACPANVNTWRETDRLPNLEVLEKLLNPETLLEMDEETYCAHIQPRFQYIGRDELWKWRCNAVRAMANEDFAKYEPWILRALDDPDQHVRDTAVWTIERFKKRESI